MSRNKVFVYLYFRLTRNGEGPLTRNGEGPLTENGEGEATDECSWATASTRKEAEGKEDDEEAEEDQEEADEHHEDAHADKEAEAEEGRDLDDADEEEGVVVKDEAENDVDEAEEEDEEGEEEKDDADKEAEAEEELDGYSLPEHPRLELKGEGLHPLGGCNEAFRVPVWRREQATVVPRNSVRTVKHIGQRKDYNRRFVEPKPHASLEPTET